MICGVCGTENERGMRFCVKCGNRLSDPWAAIYDDPDMGVYHSEEEFSESGGFTIDSGTIVIHDNAPDSEM